MACVRNANDTSNFDQTTRTEHRAPSLRAVRLREPDYDAYHDAIRVAIRRVARRCRLTPVETDDLTNDLWVRLLANQGLAIRRFRGRGRIETYLSRVARNLVLDARNRDWGKWRSSVAAKQAGPVAVMIEQLLVRDRRTREEVCAHLAALGHAWTPQQVDELAGRFPKRFPRRVVSDEALAGRPSDHPSPFDCARVTMDHRRAQKVTTALATAIRQLPEEDRNLLLWRFVDGRSVADIADRIGQEQKQLYRRFESILRRLRRQFEAWGLQSGDVFDVMATGGEIVALGMQAPPLADALLRPTG
jgi:RNA polymerase sigma factor (sigma-70 family)